MPRAKQNKAKCTFCAAELTKAAMTRHFAKCEKRLEFIDKVDREKRGTESLYHLCIQDAYLKDFWLDIEMRGAATLKDLDSYLRSIWLECCGHLSQFSIGDFSTPEIPKSRKVTDVFSRVTEITHIYDFGTSSYTKIKNMGIRKGTPLSIRPIFLMARNLIPECECIECGQPASWLCMECMIEDNVWGVLCDKHKKSHPHKNYDEPIRIVNSPRLGMCGYTGPAEPPY